jgi:hypothetical protein
MRPLVCGLGVLVCLAHPAAAASVSLSEAAAMGKFAAALLQSKGEVPETIDMALPQGGGIRMKADSALLFFCDALSRWSDEGRKSDAVDLPRGYSHLRATPKAQAVKEQADLARVETAGLVGQCRSLPSVVKRAGGLPSAVWVGEKRLSTVQFFGAVLNVLAGATQGGNLPESVSVPSWRSPESWPVCPPFEPAGPAGAAGGDGASKLITIKPDGGSPVSGSVSITVSYSGKLEYLEVSLDGKQKWMGNCSPFSFVWKTGETEDGEHKIAVRAVDKDGGELRLERTFTVNNPS